MLVRPVTVALLMSALVAPCASSAASAARDSTAAPVARVAPPTMPEESLSGIRARVRGRVVRIHLGGERPLTGHADFLREGVLMRPRVFEVGGGPRTPIAWSDIGAVEVRHGRSLLGAVAGGGLVAGAIFAASASPRLSYDYNLGEGGAAMAAIMLVPVGVAVGALVGTLVPRWEQVY